MFASDNALFVHVPRTGGWSVTQALKPHLRPVRMHHSPATEVLESHPDHYKFAWVRNPWDRLVSMWMSRWNTDREREFSAFVYGFEKESNRVRHLWHMSQAYWLLDPEGNLAVDHAARFEKLGPSFVSLCRHLDLPPLELKHFHRCDHPPYQEYYDDDLRQYVAEKCAWEIAAYEYDFDLGMLPEGMDPADRLSKDVTYRNETYAHLMS